jgi:RNA-directed DNA polymerase
MKRKLIDIQDVASFDNLAKATVLAAKGKRMRPEVQGFYSDFYKSLNNLRSKILTKEAPYGEYRKFTIHDPKKRIIHAACFKDRVLHHALIQWIGSVFERAMVPTTFACRPGKGPLKAVKWVQACTRKYPWYLKCDIRKYFDSIDQHILFEILCRKIKGKDVLELIKRIINSYNTASGKGLPIGSLTSQYFANYYLDGLDRFIKEQLKAMSHVRYMDDIIIWGKDRESIKKYFTLIKEYLEKKRLLTIKENYQVNKSHVGVTFCGFRVLPDKLKLTKRRKRRYRDCRKKWEKAYLSGLIGDIKLQLAFASVNSICLHADSTEWRRNQLKRVPSPDV